MMAAISNKSEKRGLLVCVAVFAFFQFAAVRTFAADEPAVRSSAPVTVANRAVIRLYGPIAGYSTKGGSRRYPAAGAPRRE